MSTEKLIVLANNLLNFIESNCNVGFAGALSEEKESVSDTTDFASAGKIVLKDIPAIDMIKLVLRNYTSAL